MARHGGGMRGVENEDQIDLTKEQQKAVRARSLKLLFSLMQLSLQICQEKSPVSETLLPASSEPGAVMSTRNTGSP